MGLSISKIVNDNFGGDNLYDKVLEGLGSNDKAKVTGSLDDLDTEFLNGISDQGKRKLLAAIERLGRRNVIKNDSEVLGRVAQLSGQLKKDLGIESETVLLDREVEVLSKGEHIGVPRKNWGKISSVSARKVGPSLLPPVTVKLRRYTFTSLTNEIAFCPLGRQIELDISGEFLMDDRARGNFVDSLGQMTTEMANRIVSLNLKNLDAMNIDAESLQVTFGAIEGIRGLRSFHIEQYPFAELAGAEFNVERLEIIFGAIGRMEGLENLSLNCDVGRFDAERLEIIFGAIGQMQGLKSLNLSGIRLSDLNTENLRMVFGEIGKLEGLRSFILGSHTGHLDAERLRIIFGEIGKLEELQDIKLGGGFLENVDAETLQAFFQAIGEMHALRSFDMTNVFSLNAERLETFFEIMGRLQGLEKLSLRRNPSDWLDREDRDLKLRVLYEGLGSLQALKHLDLSDTPRLRLGLEIKLAEGSLGLMNKITGYNWSVTGHLPTNIDDRILDVVPPGCEVKFPKFVDQDI